MAKGCAIDLTLVLTSEIIKKYPALVDIGGDTGPTRAGDEIETLKPLDGEVRLRKCRDGQCHTYKINAGTFKGAGQFIAEYFPGEERVNPEITGEFPNNCSGKGRRFVHYCLAYVIDKAEYHAKDLSEDKRDFLKRVYEERLMSDGKMSVGDLKKYLAILKEMVAVRSGGLKDDNVLFVYQTAIQEIEKMIQRK